MAQCLGKAFLSFSMKSTRLADDGQGSSSPSLPSSKSAWMMRSSPQHSCGVGNNERSTSFTTAQFGDTSSSIMDSTTTIPSPVSCDEPETPRSSANTTSSRRSPVDRYSKPETAPLDALANERRYMDAPTRTLLRRCHANGDSSRIAYKS